MLASMRGALTSVLVPRITLLDHCRPEVGCRLARVNDVDLGGSFKGIRACLPALITGSDLNSNISSTRASRKLRTSPVTGGVRADILRAADFFPNAEQPSEVSDLIFHHASTASSLLTGAEFMIDGGELAGACLASRSDHITASIALDYGANVIAVAKVIGHPSPKVSVDTYADLFDTHNDEVSRASTPLDCCVRESR